MAKLYYLDEGQNLVQGKIATITGDEARHAAQVARIVEGERVLLGDRKGRLGEAHAHSVTPTKIKFEVQTVEIFNFCLPEISLIQALAKGGRDEMAIQTCTELGIDRIIPWQAERSVPRWDHKKAERARARWQRITLEASKQSIRATVPTVSPLVNSSEILELGLSGQLLLLDPNGRRTLNDISPISESEKIILIVGPEGGLTEHEKKVFMRLGAQDVRLGKRILRTSTAGAAALAVINFQLGRF